MLVSSAAHAAEETRIVAGGDYAFSLGWTHDDRRANLRREVEGTAGGGRTLLQDDLTYRHTRDTLHLRAEAGVWQDLSLFAALPLVLADERQVGFAAGVDE